jgi:thioredoxin reductase (NADPH)
LAGKSVVIVGGGDAALENSILLADTAATVTLVHRRSQFSARPVFSAALAGLPNVRVITEARLLSINGTSAVESVSVESLRDGSTERIEAQAVLIRVGVIPNSELVANVVDLDENGYVVVDAIGRSSAQGVYGVGDVANPTAPTIAGAVGMGATAAKAIAAELQTD